MSSNNGPEQGPEAPVFAGEYPTREEVILALKLVELDQYQSTPVRWRGDKGPLADVLTHHQSERLLASWPNMLEILVRSMVLVSQDAPIPAPATPRAKQPPHPRKGN